MKRGNKNIIIIGMPGCGKTTIGKLISDKLNREFYDVDCYIEKKEGRSIPDIFRDHGEGYFRNLEKSAVEEVRKYTECIISSGGGVVKLSSNMELLRKNGIIIFINRTVDDIISDIEIEGRPLLKNGKERLYKLYAERIELYRKYCDYEIKNRGCIDEVVNEILDIIQTEGSS